MDAVFTRRYHHGVYLGQVSLVLCGVSGVMIQSEIIILLQSLQITEQCISEHEQFQQGLSHIYSLPNHYVNQYHLIDGWFLCDRLIGIWIKIQTGSESSSLDVIWTHEFGAMLDQIMACCLKAPSHYLIQCRFIVNYTIKNRLQWKFSQTTIQSDAFIIWSNISWYHQQHCNDMGRT